MQCSEPPTDLLDLFFSHMLRMSNVQLHPWNTCTKKAVGQLAPDVSRTAYEKDPGFTFRTVIWTRLLIFSRKMSQTFLRTLNFDVARKFWRSDSCEPSKTLTVLPLFTSMHVCTPLWFVPANQQRSYFGMADDNLAVHQSLSRVMPQSRGTEVQHK